MEISDEDIKPDQRFLTPFSTIKNEPISKPQYNDGQSEGQNARNTNNDEDGSLESNDDDVKELKQLNFIDVKTDLKSTDAPISVPQYIDEQSDITNTSNTEQEEDRCLKSEDDVKNVNMFNFTGPDVVKRESTDEPISVPQYINKQSDITNTEHEEDRSVISGNNDVKDVKLFDFTGPDVVKREPESSDEEECPPDFDENVDYHELLRRAMEEEKLGVSCIPKTNESKKEKKDYPDTDIHENVGEY